MSSSSSAGEWLHSIDGKLVTRKTVDPILASLYQKHLSSRSQSNSSLDPRSVQSLPNPNLGNGDSTEVPLQLRKKQPFFSRRYGQNHTKHSSSMESQQTDPLLTSFHRKSDSPGPDQSPRKSDGDHLERIPNQARIPSSSTEFSKDDFVNSAFPNWSPASSQDLYKCSIDTIANSPMKYDDGASIQAKLSTEFKVSISTFLKYLHLPRKYIISH